MKKELSALLTAVMLFGQYELCARENSAQPVTVREIPQAVVYQPESYLIRKSVELGNHYNLWKLYLLQLKPRAGASPYTKITLNAGPFGFAPTIEFFRLKVDGITLNKILPQGEDFTSFQQKDTGGAGMKLNYNGVRFLLKFCLVPDSPLLHGMLCPAPDTLKKPKDILLTLGALPSKLVIKEGKVQWSGAYERAAGTAVRTIRQSKQSVRIDAGDQYLILHDEIHDGSAADKGQGPCAIVFDRESVRQAVLRMGNYYTANLDLALNYGNFYFALLQFPQRMSNQEFMAKFSPYLKNYQSPFKKK